MSEKCGCDSFPVGPDMRGDGRMMYEIAYCPLHAAAPEMYAELQRLQNVVGEVDFEIIGKLLVKAEGR